MSDQQRRIRLAARQLLVPRARAASVESVVDALVALHSSDPGSVYLSACLRMIDGSVEAVERALYVDRTLIRFHAMRRTIWVMTPATARFANAGFSRKVARSERRRTATLFGRDQAWLDDAVERVVAAINAADGPISTRDVARSVPDLAEPVVVNAHTAHQGTIAAHTRALLQAAFEGRIVRTRPAGTWIGSQYAWAANDDWMAIDWSEPDDFTGATEIVVRWLERFGPGTLDDIVWWTGSTKGLIRRILVAVDAEEVELDDRSVGYVLPGDLDPVEPEEAWVALLPGLDSTSMGWKERGWYLDAENRARVTDRAGNVGPTVWSDGRIVGSWVQRPDGEIAHDAEGLSRSQRRLVETEIERVREVVGDTRFSVRFPAPSQTSLLA